MGIYGYYRNTTPFLDALGKKGSRFNFAFATGSSTPYSFTSLLSSTYPLDYSPIPSLKHPLREALASVLSDHSYKAAAFHSNVYTSSRHGYDRGFSTFIDLKEKGHQTRQKKLVSPIKRVLKRTPGVAKISRKIRKLMNSEIDELPYVRGPETTTAVEAWLSKQTNDVPIFLWVHYMDPHHPFLFSEFLSEWNPTLSETSLIPSKKLNFPGEISPSEHEMIIDFYDAEIKLADSQIKRLVTKWNSMNPDSLVIITSDHGEEFREHGSYSHTAKLFDELIHVPLLIVGPHIPAKNNSDLVSLLDIPPTILDFIGLPPEPRFEGQALFSKKYQPRDYVISETMELDGRVSMKGTGNHKMAIRAKKWKFIYESEGKPHFYDLVKDPREQLNVISEKQELLPELNKLVQIHRSSPKRDYHRLSRFRV